MKHVIPLLIVFSLAGCAGLKPVTLYEKEGKLLGTLPLVNNKVAYQAHYALADLSKEAIYERASQWYTLTYPNSDAGPQVVQREPTTLIQTVHTKIHVKSATVWQASHYRLDYVLSITVSGSGYEVSMSGIAFYLPAVNVYTPAKWIPIEAYNLGTEKSLLATFQAVDEAMRQAMANLSAYIQAPSN